MLAVAILEAQPFVKAVLRNNFIAEMPLAIVGTVCIVWRHFGQSGYFGRELQIVARCSMVVWVKSGQDRGPRRRARRLRHVGVFEDQAFFSQPVQVRCGACRAPVTTQGIGPLLVGEDE